MITDSRFESLAKMERAPRGEREAYLAEGLRKICQHAYSNSMTWKKRFDEAGFDPSSVSTLKDLENIPVLTRDELIKQQRENPPFGGFLTVPMENLKRVYIHPGPQYETLSEADIYHTSWAMKKALQLEKGDIVINTVSYHMVPAGLLFDEAITGLGIPVVPTGVGNTDLQIQIMRDLKVNVFAGFPSFLLNVIQRAEEMGLDVRRDLNLKKSLAIGKTEVRKMFEDDYGINTREGYGFLPIGFPAAECDQKNGMHVEEDFILEIVDPVTGKQLGPGEVGEVVVTTIFTETSPRIRIGSGDLGYITDEPCPCGRTSNRLMQIVGRVGEAVKVRSMFVHPAEVGEVVARFSEISGYQLSVCHVDRKDMLTATLELADEGANKDALTEGFKKEFQSRCRVKIDKVEFVSKGAIPGDAKKIVDERKEVIL